MLNSYREEFACIAVEVRQEFKAMVPALAKHDVWIQVRSYAVLKDPRACGDGQGPEDLKMRQT